MLRTKRIVAPHAVKAVSPENRMVEAWVSTADLDRDGEIVRPEAFRKRLGTFRQNPLFLWMHNPFAVPLGKVEDIQIEDERIGAKLWFRKSQQADEVLAAYEDGTLTSFSIGFRVHATERRRKDDGTPGPVTITDAELYEVSAVTLPANPKARVKLAGLEFEQPGEALLEAQRIVSALADARVRGEQVDDEILKVAQDLRCLMFGVPRRVERADHEELRAALAGWRKLA